MSQVKKMVERSIGFKGSVQLLNCRNRHQYYTRTTASANRTSKIYRLTSKQQFCTCRALFGRYNNISKTSVSLPVRASLCFNRWCFRSKYKTWVFVALKPLQVLDKELAEIQLSEELKSMTLQAEEYKVLR